MNSQLQSKQVEAPKPEVVAVKPKLSPAEEYKQEQAAEVARERADKRSERKAHVQKKLEEASKRYRDVFGTELSDKDLAEFREYCRYVEKMEFLEARFLRLSKSDEELLVEIIQERNKRGKRVEE